MMPKVELQKEHHWLQQLVGEWTYENEASMGPGQPPTKFTGTESVRSLGGVWVLCEGRMPVPDGSPATTIMTLGYDPAKKRFVGSFVGSMMTFMWLYDGGLDASGKVLKLDAEGPSFAVEGKMAKYVDAIEIVSGDHRRLTSSFLGDDGQWHQFMTANYHRVK
jgi:hypothetical protein